MSEIQDVAGDQVGNEDRVDVENADSSQLLCLSSGFLDLSEGRMVCAIHLAQIEK